MQVKDRVIPPVNKNRGPRQWIVGRDHCLYQLFPMSDMPPAERKSAVDVAIRQWSPFADSGTCVVWHEDMAQVWIWDEAERRKAAAENGVVKAQAIPETLLQPVPNQDGVRLVSCGHGVEGQIWKHGVLAASHWWPLQPDRDNWIRFLLSSDYDPGMTIMEPEKCPFLDKPWGRSSTLSRTFLQFQEKRLVAAIFFVLSFVMIWQLVSLWKWQDYRNDLQEQVGVLTSQVQPLLTSRGQALEDRRVAEELLSLSAYPTMLELWAVMIERQVGKDVRMIDWHYSEGKLSFTLQGKNMDPRFNVKAFQEHPFFTGVTVEKGRNPMELTVSMSVEKK